MLLKRNVLTIIYSFVFMLLLGIGFIEVMFLAISSSNDRNVVACIIIIGILIYLIAAFLLKEKNKMQFLQAEKPLFQIIEAIFVLSLITLAFFLNLDAGIQISLMGSILLAVIYGCSRLLGGRLCGIIASVIGFFLYLYLSSAGFETDHTMDILCILVPYFVFLLITKKITVIYIQQPFLIIVSYLMLAVVFSLAAIVDPLVILLAIGCIFSLLFGKLEKKGSVLVSGPFLAFILFAAIVAILAGVSFFMPEMNIGLSPELDIKIKQMGTSYMDILSYLLKKYLKTSDFLYDASETGVFSSILFFYSSLAGFYAIRKKSSAIGPLSFAYLGTLVYHLLYLGNADEFYYIFYFLPVFVSYGIYNTLLPEEITVAATETQEEMIETEKGPDSLHEPEPEALTQTESQLEPQSQPEVLLEPQQRPETGPSLEVDPDLKTDEENTSESMLQKIKKEKKKKSQIKRNTTEPSVTEPIVPDNNNMVTSEIPEWTVSENFLKAAKNGLHSIKSPKAELPQEGVPIPAPMNLSETEQLPETEQPDRVEQITETEFFTETESSPEIEISTKIEPSSELQLFPDTESTSEKVFKVEEPVSESLEILTPEITIPETTIDITIPENTADIDISIPAFTDTDEDQLLLDEPQLSSVDEPSLLSENSLTSDHNIADESNMLEHFSDVDNDADAQLNTLLNRLDISDNIRRMNESAREDIADIIERDVTENELHEAKPAAELDFEPHQPLPKYVKPEFDFEIEPMSQPLQDTQGSISEYDKVPTINDLEKKWRDVSEVPRDETVIDIPGEYTSETQYSFAYSLEDIEDVATESGSESGESTNPQIHSEEIVKENGMNKRSYHKITIG